MMRSRLAVIALLLVPTLGALSCGSGSSTGPGFTVTPSSASLIVGNSVQFTAVNAPSSVTWSSSDSKVATVIPQTGYTTAVGGGTATISAVAGTKVASATVTVTSPAAIVLPAPTVTFSIAQGAADPAPDTLAVTDGGDDALTGLRVDTVAYGQGQPTGWLSATLASASAPTKLVLKVSKGSLAAGTYTATVAIAADSVANSPQSLVVTFRILTPPAIALSRDTVPVATVTDSTVTDSLTVTDTGTMPLTGLFASVGYTSGFQGWLSTAFSSDSAPATLYVTANTHGLPLGHYYANVQVASSVPSVSPKTFEVALTVATGPAIALSTTSLTVNASAGANPTPRTVDVTNSGGLTLTGLALSDPAYTGTGGWLTATLDSTTAPATISLRIDSKTLPQADYQAVLSVSSANAGNSPVALTVKLHVGPPAQIAVSPASLTFSTFTGATNLPRAQGLSVTEAAGGSLTGLSATVHYAASGPTGWLQAPVWQNGNTATPAVLLVQPDTMTLPLGTYTATIALASDSDAAVDTVAVTVKYVVQSFTTAVVPLFTTTFSGYTGTPCQTCHTYTTSQQWYTFATGAVNDGQLVCTITNTCTRSSNMQLPAAAVATIEAWIAAGMPYP